MTLTGKVSSWPDVDVDDLRDLLASGSNKDARWLAFSESKYFQRIAPLTKTDFLKKEGIERIFRDATAMHGAGVSPAVIRQCLRQGWVYEFDKPIPSSSIPKSGSGETNITGSLFTLFIIAIAGLTFGAFMADEQPKTLFTPKDSYSTDEFASSEEKELYGEIRVIPSSKTTENLEGYQRLVQLNPQKPHYKAKVDHYEEKRSTERAEAEAARRQARSSATSNLSSTLSESEAKSRCQARVTSQESVITTICSTRSCINHEVAERFGSCMLGYGFGRL
jgi:hypothetical protein